MGEQVSVNPNDLESFADYMDDLLDRLTEPRREFNRMRNGGTIRIGDFSRAEGFVQTHDTVAAQTADVVTDLVHQIKSLRDAAREIAGGYRDAESVNEALVRAMERFANEGAAPPRGV